MNIGRFGAISALACALAAAGPPDLELWRIPGGLSFPPRHQRPAPSPPDSGTHPGCDLIATGAVLADLQEAALALKEEARELKDDSELLWYAWRSNVGIAGAPPRWLADSEESHRPFILARGEKLQADLFRLFTQTRNAERRSLALIERLERAQGGWRHIRDLPEDESRRGLESGSLSAVFSECVEDLKDIASKTAQEDKTVRDLQKDLDEAFANLSLFLNSQMALDPGLKRPWHWGRIYTGIARRDFLYDVEERFEDYRDRACKKLNAGVGK